MAAEPLAGTAARRSPPCWHTTRQPDARCARRRRLWRRTTRLELLAAGWREGAVCNRSRRNSPQGDTTRSRGRRRARRACRLAAAAGARHVIAYGLALLGGLVAGVTSRSLLRGRRAVSAGQADLPPFSLPRRRRGKAGKTLRRLYPSQGGWRREARERQLHGRAVEDIGCRASACAWSCWQSVGVALIRLLPLTVYHPILRCCRSVCMWISLTNTAILPCVLYHKDRSRRPAVNCLH